MAPHGDGFTRELQRSPSGEALYLNPSKIA